MNIAKINKCDTGNGDGIRVSVFVSGCPHHCKGCFNQETWDYDYGNPYTIKIQEEINEALSKEYVRGLSLLGGEPLAPKNQKQVLQIIENSKIANPNIDVYLWTGYTLEELKKMERDMPTISSIFHQVDVLIDGRFIEELKDLTLYLRGSSNQQIHYLHE